MNDTETLHQIEEMVGRYLRRDVPAENGEAIAACLASHDAFVKAQQQAEQDAQRGIEEERRKIHEVAGEIARMDAALSVRPGPGAEAAAIDDFNLRMRKRNALAARHDEAVAAFNAAVRAFNARQGDAARETKRRNEATEEAIAKYNAEYKAYADWCNSDGHNRLWNCLNQVFAGICARTGGTADSPDLALARRLRKEIAACAIARQEQSGGGSLTVAAQLGCETVYLLVDTGASVVLVSPEMVAALGWSGLTGEIIELRLAGGLRLRAPQLLVPELSVQGQAADHVKGAVVADPGFGCDGCMGLSFLNRFQYTIRAGDRPPCLALSAKSAVPPHDYDVFLCHKSEDAEPARALFDYLRAEGYRPFFSPVSLGVNATSAFQHGIDRALEDAAHMVVVGSCLTHMEEPWVRSEWQRFLAMRHMGRKSGNLVVLLCGSMRPVDLPVGLVDCNAISNQSEGWREAIRSYLPK